MSDSAARLDRYLADKLSAAEQRELAQEALDDPALFDELTAAAIVKAGLARSSDAPVAPRTAGRRRALVWGGLVAAAAIVTFVVVQRNVSIPAPASVPVPVPLTASAGSSAAPAAARTLPQPVILTARFDADRLTSVDFRGSSDDTRAPRSMGMVVAIDGQDASIDLGSIDGLQKDAVVQIVGAASGSTPSAALTIARVFRERATGVVAPSGAAHIGDRVELSAATQVGAILDRLAARRDADDLAAARAIAERAVSLSAGDGVPADDRRRAYAYLGAIEHRAGALDAAEQHLRIAAADVTTAPASSGANAAVVLNELGAVLLEQGKYDDSQRVLRDAESRASGGSAVAIANNLAALAALRGDVADADRRYRAALALAGNAPAMARERDAITANLDALNARP